ncbi:hypothetical protein BJ970_007545 [Saccharopolyspora phatthalungensis]|uniref:Uncharacterized protein n=1 Tax=Saccharopolyspora phatthalungensis TaxID=664693 RepID=A0A840QKI9_9PSEU|nr:hypothetical protein [Saccharopolyspora phatthalungensis]
MKLALLQRPRADPRALLREQRRVLETISAGLSAQQQRSVWNEGEHCG